MQPAGKSTSVPSCRACTHVLRYGTCACPAEAGLVDQHLPPPQRQFSIVWPEAAHARACPAFVRRERAPA